MSKEDIFETITADASQFSGLTTEAGKELSELIKSCNDFDKRLTIAQDEVAFLQKQRNRYLNELIPDKMGEVGLDKCEVNGSSVSLTTFVQATMPKDPYQKKLAMDHLRDIGCEDWIKNTLSVKFGINQDNQAKSIKADLEDAGLYPELGERVEPATLRKLVKDRYVEGQEINLELFNAFVGTRAKLKGS
jgi:hypothetical protein